MNIFQSISSIFNLLYPKTCLYCSVNLIDGEEFLCITCLNELPISPVLNGKSSPVETQIAGKIPFQHTYSFMYYYKNGISGHLLKQIKYHKNQDLALYLGSLFGKSISFDPTLKNIDAIIPVPLHPKRESNRGFNQSALIAMGMSKHLEIPIDNSAIIRTKYSKSQTTKAKEERIDSSKKMYKLTDSNPLKNKHILLLDDVITTGSTLESCAHPILSHSDIKISVASLCVPYG